MEQNYTGLIFNHGEAVDSTRAKLWSAFRLLRSQSDKYFDELKAKYPEKGSVGFYEGKRETELIIENEWL